MFWAINSALLWPYYFQWFFCFSWIVIVRSFALSERWIVRFKYISLSLFLLTVLYLLFVNVCEGTAIGWNQWFGYNANQIASFVVVLLPIVLNVLSKFKNGFVFQIVAFIMAVAVAILAKSLGAFLALCLLLVLLLFINSAIKRSIVFYGIGGLILSVLCFYIFPDAMSSLVWNLKDLRFDIYNASLSAFKNQPLFGYGLGNWDNAVYWINAKSHNLYLTIIIELGIIGFLLFSVYIVQVLASSFLRVSDANTSSGLTFILYLALSLFYNISNSSPYIFNITEFYVMCNIGIFTVNSNTKNSVSKTMNWGLTIFSIITMLWYANTRYVNQQYRRARVNIHSNQVLALDLLKKCFHPIWRHEILDGKNLPLQIANQNVQLKQYEKANDYFEICSQRFPKNQDFLISYSSFLYHHKKDTVGAWELILEADQFRRQSIELDLLVVEYFIDAGEINNARIRLDSIKSDIPFHKKRISKLQNRLTEENKKKLSFDID